jgi:predicted CopG family antitoxin
MRKKLTLTIAKDVYDGLHQVVGRRKISRFVEDLLRPRVLKRKLELGYEEMAADKDREQEAFEWCEGMLSCQCDQQKT